MTSTVNTPQKASAALDSAHVGDIQGALGTIRMDDEGPRVGMSAKMHTFVRTMSWHHQSTDNPGTEEGDDQQPLAARRLRGAHAAPHDELVIDQVWRSGRRGGVI